VALGIVRRDVLISLVMLGRASSYICATTAVPAEVTILIFNIVSHRQYFVYYCQVFLLFKIDNWYYWYIFKWPVGTLLWYI